MVEDVSKVNILIFKDSSCIPCIKIEPILRQIVATSQGATLTIIDIEKETELARKFNIDNIPVVYYNDKLALSAEEAVELISGIDIPDKNSFVQPMESSLNSLNNIFGNSESSLFTHLFNRLINYSIESNDEDLERRLKYNMLAISQKTMSADAIQYVSRPSLGDYVHIGILQSVVTSMLAINPRSSEYLYRVGRDMGRFGNVQFRFLTNFPKIMDNFDDANKFRDVIEGLIELYSANSLGLPLYLVSRSFVKPIDDKSAILTVYDSAFCSHISPIDQPVCYLIAGEISGLIESIIGNPVSVIETKCQGLGDPLCQFFIELYKERDFSFINERVFLTESEKEKLQRCLVTISKNMYSSSLIRNVLRPGFSDHVHISVLQQTLNGIKFSDPFFSTLLFYAGLYYGKFGADYAIIERILKGMGDVELPIDFEDSLYVLKSYFIDPSMILTRWQGNVQLEVVNNETAILNIYESAIAAGLDLKDSDLILDASSETTLCDFTAGFIQGRLSRICDQNIKVSEIKCISLGAKYCQFKVELE